MQLFLWIRAILSGSYLTSHSECLYENNIYNPSLKRVEKRSVHCWLQEVPDSCKAMSQAYQLSKKAVPFWQLLPKSHCFVEQIPKRMLPQSLYSITSTPGSTNIYHTYPHNLLLTPSSYAHKTTSFSKPLSCVVSGPGIGWTIL